MRPSELSGRRVGLYGYGRDGRSVHRWLRDRLGDVPITVLEDAGPSPALAEAASGDAALTVRTGDAVDDALEQLDVVVRSPGVSVRRGRLAAARSRGLTVVTSLQLWFDEHRPGNVVGITATKGKSTTSALTAHLLRAAGERVALAGNIGTPVLDLDAPPAAYDHVVLELSSYQLADLDAPLALGAILNLYREHVDWHGSVARYHADKLRITDLAATLVANAGDVAVARAAADHPDVRWFRADGDPLELAGGVLDRDRLAAALGSAGAAGRHNVTNACAALAIVAALGTEPTEVLDAVAGFEPLPHRLQLIHEAAGVRWIDDSISTVPEAAIAAVDAFPDVPVTLIAGGFDRGQDHRELCDRLTGSAVGAVIALPDTGSRLAAELRRRGVTVHEVTDLAAAVALAREVTPTGGVVLLSPAAPSYNHFRDFQERGDRFAELARAGA